MRLHFVLFILFCISCKNNENLKSYRIERDQYSSLFSESIQYKIDSIVLEKYHQANIVSISLTRLSSSNIICIRPVFDSLFISDHGIPYLTYNSRNKLYLVYSALETFNSNKKNISILEKFDSVCKVNKIGGLDFTNDMEISYYKFLGGNLMPYNNLAFENVFYERKPADSIDVDYGVSTQKNR